MNERIKGLAEQAGLECVALTEMFVVSREFLEIFAKLIEEAEREAIIDIVAFNGGSVEIEADIRKRSEK